MTRTTIVVSVLAALLLVASFNAPAEAEFVTATTPIPPPGAPGSPTPGLSGADLDQWIRGRIVFDRDWKLGAGLGSPEFNSDSCRGCHQKPAIGGAGGLDVNVYRFASDNLGAGPFTNLPGGQMGSKLRRLDFAGREDHDPASDVFEQRNTPSVLGLGLVDQIADADILANEDPTDSNADGIFGVARLSDVGGGVMEVGHFGWKAQVPHLLDFARDASFGEVGLTVSDTSRGFGATTDNDGIADPEISDTDLADMIFYIQNLAPPTRGGSTSPLVALGEQIFTQIGCAVCHTPSLPSPSGPVALYSNLLLHNIWFSTFRGMEEPGAGRGMYKTPVLWGISTTAPYMHDGRAETLLDAIQLHEGEAITVRTAFLNLTTGEKDALILFLKDL